MAAARGAVERLSRPADFFHVLPGPRTSCKAVRGKRPIRDRRVLVVRRGRVLRVRLKGAKCSSCTLKLLTKALSGLRGF